MLRILILVLAIMTCFAGAFISDMLRMKSINPATLPPIFEEVCSDAMPETQPGKVSTGCDVVAESEYSSFLGMPNGYWGMIYFLGVGLWLLVIGVPSYEKRILHLGLSLAATGSILGSVVYIYLMKFVIEATCPWCMASHACNFTLWGLILLLYFTCRRPKNPAYRIEPDAKSEEEAVEQADSDELSLPDSEGGSFGLISGYFDYPNAHPTMRLQVCAALAILFMGAMYWQNTLLQDREVNLAQAQETIERLPEEARAALKEQIDAFEEDVYRLYQRSPKTNIDLRPDDPVRITGDNEDKISLVIFSDLECPSCRRYAHQLEDELMPLFENNFKVYFKHFPLSKKCNKKMRREMHPHACELAYAAEAARLQGGSEAFWNAHDLLFKKSENRRALRDLDYRGVAEELGLDPDKFVEDMQSDVVKQRIQEDIALARKLGVHATPTVFLAKKQVPQYARTHKKFWERLAEIYKKRYLKPEPPKKPLKVPASTDKDVEGPPEQEAEAGESD